MAQPTEIFGTVKGMTRDFAVDNLPEGYLWNLVDGIPNRKGARVDIRGGWAYHGTPRLRRLSAGRLLLRLRQRPEAAGRRQLEGLGR